VAGTLEADADGDLVHRVGFVLEDLLGVPESRRATSRLGAILRL
jgi:hypothetical protein